MESLVSGGRLSELVARAETLARDTTFSQVRRWKECSGGLAAGFMPVYVLRDLLHSQGVLGTTT